MRGSMLRAVVINVVIVLILAGAVGIGYAYWYQGQNYVSTDDAQVTAPMAPVGVASPGVLLEWRVKVGDRVARGDVLGSEQVPSLSGAAASASSPAPPRPEPVEIRSPLDGTVVESTAVAGAAVVPGVPLAYVADLAHVQVTAYVPETAIRHIRVDQPVDVWIDAFPGNTLSGRVKEIEPATAASFSLLPAAPQGGEFTKVTQRVPVIIGLDDAQGLALRLGMSARVRIHIG